VPLIEDQPEVIEAGFSWKAGLLMGGLLIGGALFMRSQKAGKGKGYERKSKSKSKSRKSTKRSASKRRGRR